jgi:flagellar FliL protein
MAEQEQPADPQPDSTEAPAGGNLVRTLMVLGFVLVVVLVECAVAMMVLPSAEDIATLAQAQKALQNEGPNLPLEVVDEQLEIAGDTLEVDLGDFSVSAYQPLSNTTVRIDFHLYGLVLTNDEGDLLDMLEENQHRFREQVLVILRSAEITDLTDAGLGLIKRKILEKTNRALGKVLLQEVIFSDFSFVEQ